MKSEPKSNCVIRVSSQLHRDAKSLAAREGIPLSTLVGVALEKELRHREARELRRIATARPAPVQTR